MPTETTHVVALSGGKDSTALALWLADNEPRDYHYVITPTGNELPDMVAHWSKLRDMLGGTFVPVTRGFGLHARIKHHRMLPNHRARWCTRELKIEPYYAWIMQHVPAVSYVGLRSDESDRQGMIFPEPDGVTLRFPLREIGWSEQDVWDFLDDRGIKIPARTDCAWCYHQTLGEWYRLWYDHPEIYAEGEAMEVWVGKERGSAFTFRSPQRDTWPTDLKGLRERFELGDIPPRTVHTDDLFAGGRRMTGICRVCSM